MTDVAEPRSMPAVAGPSSTADWKLFQGTGPDDRDPLSALPPAPPWRTFDKLNERRGRVYKPGPEEIEAVNAALILRRPLLVTGSPGCGKSSLAYAVAEELKANPVLRWSINSRSTLAEGLYYYDAIARLRDANLENAGVLKRGTSNDIGRYMRLGALGTALLPTDRPRVLLIDEIDKSDVDLPNDLLHVFEEGSFEIPELRRLTSMDDASTIKVLPSDKAQDSDRVPVPDGIVRCRAFPFVLLTSNGERDLPPAFFRRCLRLTIPNPDASRLRDIAASHLQLLDVQLRDDLIGRFLEKQNKGLTVATDQLLNALFLVTQGRMPPGEEQQRLLAALLKELDRP
jgi:MoxR-like ATPase